MDTSYMRHQPRYWFHLIYLSRVKSKDGLMRSRPSATSPRANLMQPMQHLYTMHGLYSKWNYVLHVTDLENHSLSELLQPLEAAMMSTFFPALTGQSPPGELIRKLLALPTHAGGLSLVNPIDASVEQHCTSKLISAPL